MLADRHLLPLVDFAYQGFGDGLREDAAGLLAVAAASPELLVASSFSKNFALYAERVGALSIVAADARQAEVAMSHAKVVVRTLYSNPPAHGGEVVATILLDTALRARWEAEVAGMRDRINGNRQRFVEGLRAAAVPFDPTPLLRQRGMFSLLEMTTDQVDAAARGVGHLPGRRRPRERGRADRRQPGAGLRRDRRRHARPLKSVRRSAAPLRRAALPRPWARVASRPRAPGTSASGWQRGSVRAA